MRLSLKSLIVPFLFLVVFACEEEVDPLSIDKSASDLSESVENARGKGVVESVTGSGHLDLEDGLRVFTFNARKKADGSVDGVYTLNRGGTKFKGRIYCFTVVGNEAYVTGILEKSNVEDVPSFMPPAGFFFKVVDNGEGANAAADQISFSFFGTGLTEEVLDGYCADLFDVDLFDIDAGNIQIH